MSCVRACVVVMSVLAAGCTPQPVERAIELVELGEDRWRATWYFPEPVDGLRFARTAHFFREDAWRITTPGFELARDGNFQVVVASSLARATEISIEFPTDTRRFAREHEFFHQFTDGGVAVYTGMLHAQALGSDETLRVVRIRPRDGRPAFLRNDAAVTYAYVGNIAPVRTEHMAFVFDPGLPQWLRQTVEMRIGAFVNILVDRTGHVLPRQSLVLFNFVPGPGDSYAYRGGVTEGLVQLSALGDAWHDPDPGAVRGMLRFVAHEAVHLLNSDLVRWQSGTPPWLYEGSADAIGDRLLVAAGILDATALDGFTDAAFRECTILDGGAPLDGTRIDRAHYACGRLVMEWSERILRNADSDASLFTALGEMIERALARGGTYGQHDWFEALKHLGADPVEVARMQALVHDADADADAWRRALAPYGVTFTE